jgi:drug/metabolite transporter (DMT)-like permease
MHAPLKADLFILSSTLVAASGWILSMKSLEGLPPLLFIGLRFVVASVVVAVVAALIDPRPRAGALASSALTGVLLLRGWPMPRATKMALPLAVVGMGFLFLNDGGFHVSVGDAFYIGSALASAAYFVFTTEQTGRIPVLTLTAGQLAVTGVVNLALSIGLETWPTALPGMATFGWVAASIFLGTSLRFFLQVSGQSAAPLSHVALMMCLEPIWTAAIATIWLATAFTLPQGIGCALILVALVVNSRKPAATA